jgi:CheY-like chemotaxis protein
MSNKGQCKSVLVVEDEKSIREALTSALEYEGFAVFSAENGKVALELLPTVPGPCLVLLDLMMPVMNGWEFAEAMNNNPATASNSILVVSAFGAKDLGVKTEGVVRKPIDLDDLVIKLKKLCA